MTMPFYTAHTQSFYYILPRDLTNCIHVYPRICLLPNSSPSPHAISHSSCLLFPFSLTLTISPHSFLIMLNLVVHCKSLIPNSQSLLNSTNLPSISYTHYPNFSAQWHSTMPFFCFYPDFVIFILILSHALFSHLIPFLYHNVNIHTLHA